MVEIKNSYPKNCAFEELDKGTQSESLLFVRGIEPLLQQIEGCNQIKKCSGRKVSAYANYVLCYTTF